MSEQARRDALAEDHARDLTHAIVRHYGYTDDDIAYANAVHPGRICDEDCYDDNGKTMHGGIYDELHTTASLVVDCVMPLIDTWLTEARAEALREVADAWQWKAWADVLLPGSRNPIENGQRVTDWLRQRAALAATEETA